MKGTQSYSQTTRMPPPRMNGATVENELLYHARTQTALLIDMRHGQDILPERMARSLAPMLTRRGVARKPSWVKENTDFLRAALPYFLITVGLVLWYKEPQIFRDLVAVGVRAAMR